MAKEARRPGGGEGCHDSMAVRHLKEAIASGTPWHVALLEAIGIWTCPDESYNGHHYCYLVGGEAFDWLLLAERLALEIADVVPEEELVGLLFFGRLPQEVSGERFKEFLGSAKYYAYLNYLYGVTIEKFVVLAVDEEIRKERHSYVFSASEAGYEDSYERVYGASQEALLRMFRDENGLRHAADVALHELDEFTYWLFKHRLRTCDRERVASDTKKGVEFLKRQSMRTGLRIPGGAGAPSSSTASGGPAGSVAGQIL